MQPYERLRTIKNAMLYELHRAQNCCEVCSDCRALIIDAVIEYARSYSGLMLTRKQSLFVSTGKQKLNENKKGR